MLAQNARVQKEKELYIRADKDARYEVVAPLGEGGMARVAIAVVRGAEGFKRTFVLKRLKPEHVATFLGRKLDERYRDELGNDFSTRICYQARWIRPSRGVCEQAG